MSELIKFLAAHTNVLGAALVSAVISALVTYLLRRSETRHKVRVEYEYEQRKRLREVIGRFHGRLLSAANSLNNRLWNLYANHEKGWLAASGGYYFVSTVYRFLNVFALVRELESEAIQLDARIAEKRDFIFLNYAAVLHWVMTDVALFKGLSYDISSQTDHFFSDRFRHYSELCLRDGKFLGFEEFEKGPYHGFELKPVLEFFHDLKPRENRLRWDRIVSLHLVLMAFINAFGYDRQYSSAEQFCEVAAKICNRSLLQNLVEWLTRHDLGNEPEARKIARALKTLRARAKGRRGARAGVDS